MPPATASLKPDMIAGQVTKVPVIAAGDVFTVMVLVTRQLLLSA
jgi:hypothetical protein